MIPANASGPEDFKEAKLPRRDWILLPLLSLLTICFHGVVRAMDVSLFKNILSELLYH